MMDRKLKIEVFVGPADHGYNHVVEHYTFRFVGDKINIATIDTGTLIRDILEQVGGRGNFSSATIQNFGGFEYNLDHDLNDCIDYDVEWYVPGND